MRYANRPEAALAALVLVCAAGAARADVTLMVEGGGYDQDGQKTTLGAGFAEARLRGPIDAPIVYQFEIRAGHAHDESLGGAALRAWTDLGNRARFGAFVAVGDQTGGYDEIGQAGLEFEYYTQNTVFHVDAGYQDGDPRNDHGFVGVEGVYGLSRDLTIGVGGDFISGDDDVALATLAWRPAPYSLPGFAMSLRGEYEPSDDNYAAVFLGATLDTGATTALPLIARRRDIGAPGRLSRLLRAYLNDPA